MKRLLLILLFSFQLNAQTNKIDYIRLNYFQAVSDKSLCLEMIEQLESMKNEPVYLAYLGGLQTIKANHVFNPIKKLSTFNKGKKNIDEAVKMDPKNPEIRFVRLSIQRKAPSFLGYKKNIEDDSRLIKTKQASISSTILLYNINQLIKD